MQQGENPADFFHLDNARYFQPRDRGTSKRHDHVMRDIRAMLLGVQSNSPSFGGVCIDSKGEARACFNLPKRETLILVSGYFVELRARVIDHWMELERQASASEGRVPATEVTATLTQYVTDTRGKMVLSLLALRLESERLA